MSTTRDDALAALRAWSAPGRRADLIAAAWNAGETNVSALAEAARVTRPTVYADLRSRGIEPDHRPKETTVTTPVTLEGFTGGSDDERVFLSTLRAWAAQHPGEASTDEGFRLMAAQVTVGRYNTLRPVAQAEETARADRDRALHLVETRWEALSIATGWLAAHHAYVVAVDEAHTAIERWKEKAIEAAKIGPVFHNADGEAAYRKILQAGHPPIDPLDIDPAAEAQRLHDDLHDKHTHREALAAQTLAVPGAR